MSCTQDQTKNENLLLESQIEELVHHNDHPQETSENPTALFTPRYVEGFTQTKITRFNLTLKRKNKMREKRRLRDLKAKGYVLEKPGPSQIGCEVDLTLFPENADKSINGVKNQSEAYVYSHSDHPQEKHVNNAATQILTGSFVESPTQTIGKPHPPKKVKKINKTQEKRNKKTQEKGRKKTQEKGRKKTQEKGNKKTQQKGNKKTQQKGNKKTQEKKNKKTQDKINKMAQVIMKPLKAQGFVSKTNGSSDIGCEVNLTSSTEEPNRGQKRKADKSLNEAKSQSGAPVQSSLHHNDRYKHFGNFIAAMLRGCKDQELACNVMHKMLDLLKDLH